MERFRRNDERSRQSKNLRDAVLEYKLESGHKFKDEKTKQLELSRRLVDDADMDHLEELIDNLQSQRFGIQKLDMSMLEGMLQSKSQIQEGSCLSTQRSGTELLTHRMRKQMMHSMTFE